MAPPKRHHFVPEFILRRFCDARGRLHYFDKRRPSLGVGTTSPRNQFVETNLYSLRLGPQRLDPRLETTMSKLEGEAAPITASIVAHARLGLCPNLTPEQKALWDFFLITQLKRVPDFLDSVMPQREFDALLSVLLQQFAEEVRPPDHTEIERLKEPATLVRLQHNAWLLSMTKPATVLTGILGDKGLVVARIAKTGKSFITGSRPVVKLNYPGRSMLSDPTVELWLPIAHDVAVSPGLSRGMRD